MTQPNPCASWKRSLAIVWIGEFFSVLTSSILQMGLIWHVTLSTGSASALSFVSLAAFLPMALLGAFAGTIVDRTSIKRLMIGADLEEGIDAHAVVDRGLEAGFLLNATGPHTLRFLPPLVCSRADVDALIEKLGGIL